ncbi:NAD-dependent epimerase/dehydratase family protein [Pontibacter rugosus]
MNKTDSSGARNSDKELIVVTGSSGLIGTSIIKRLSENYRIVGLDNTGYPFPPRRLNACATTLPQKKASGLPWNVSVTATVKR